MRKMQMRMKVRKTSAHFYRGRHFVHSQQQTQDTNPLKPWSRLFGPVGKFSSDFSGCLALITGVKNESRDSATCPWYGRAELETQSLGLEKMSSMLCAS